MSDSTLGILIIIGFIILGFATGGNIFRSNVSPVATSTSGVLVSTQPDRETVAAQQNRQNAEEQLGLIHAQAIDLNERVKELSAQENTSPYQNTISISNVFNPGDFDEYITLTAHIHPGQAVTLTGWKFKSLVTGDVITIGGGANLPDYQGPTNAPIVLTSNDIFVTVSVGNSPLGYSLRLNKCTGFLDPNRLFNPSLPRNCPLPSQDEPALTYSINNDCLDYIDSLSSCTVYKERDLPDDLSRSCKNYIEKNINYNSCVANHILDSDFYEGEWRVYANNRGIFGLERRDTIELLDNFGRVVDTYQIY